MFLKYQMKKTVEKHLDTLVGRFQELQAQAVTPHGDRFANTLFLFIGDQVEDRVSRSRLANGTLEVVIDLLNTDGTVGTEVGIDVLSPVVVNFVRDVTVTRFVGATWKIKPAETWWKRVKRSNDLS